MGGQCPSWRPQGKPDCNRDRCHFCASRRRETANLHLASFVSRFHLSWVIAPSCPVGLPPDLAPVCFPQCVSPVRFPSAFPQCVSPVRFPSAFPQCVSPVCY